MIIAMRDLDARGHPGSPELDDALARLAANAGPGVARLAELAASP